MIGNLFYAYILVSGVALGTGTAPTEARVGLSGESKLIVEAGAPGAPPEEWQERGSRLAWRSSGDDISDGDFDTFEEQGLTPAQSRARRAAEAKAAEQWKRLVEAALYEPDDELRGAAINGVGLHRSAESVAVLNEVATFDISPDNRLHAVQQLWYSAADGLDPHGTIEGTLRAALDDPDEAVAKMAKKALADLEALERSRQAQ